MSKYSLILLSIITFTSCSTYKHSYRLTDVPDNSFKVTSTVVDVKTNFDMKITGESDKKTPSVADAKANTPAYQNYMKGMKRKTDGKPMYTASQDMKDRARGLKKDTM